MDGGTEFLAEFQETLDNYGCERKVTAPFNPQGNSVVEQMHQVIGDALRTFELEERDLDEDDPFGPFLAATLWATQSAHHTMLEASPGQLVFGRDMLMGAKFNADWARIAQRKIDSTNKSNKRENASRIQHTCQAGDRVSLKKPGKCCRKMSSTHKGPCKVIAVCTNGTARIQRGAVRECMNMRRITPHRSRTN